MLIVKRDCDEAKGCLSEKKATEDEVIDVHTLTTASAMALGMRPSMPDKADMLAHVTWEQSTPSTELGDM